MKRKIPAPIIGIVTDYIKDETHVKINSLFLYAGAPDNPPEGTKAVKTQEWLKRINEECDDPLLILGKLIECYMELPDECYRYGEKTPIQKFKDKLISVLERCNLQYVSGGHISDARSTPSKSLQELIKGRDIPAIEIEFNRALANINTDAREAVSAACNILESLFKIYITDQGLDMPQKQDIQGVWKVVRNNLGFEPGSVEDDDLKRILSGILSIVDGIGSFRTHASSAHGQGRELYNIESRHARLAINSAHTIALFVLETWDEKKDN